MDRTPGIQTLLMTDVVGSTRLWAAHPDAMPDAIRRLEAIAQAAVEAEGGRVVKSRGEGDSLFCRLPHPTAAVRAATALVRGLREEPWPEGLAPRVRAVVHCGDAHERDGDLFGPMPNRCARLREVGHGDQILVSGAARALVASDAGLAFRELGRHRLRDLDEPESVFQVLAPGLPEEFPPLRSLSLLRNNLPTQLSGFVGRDALRRNLRERLRTERLITLTGIGGGGKTRLALQVGADAIGDFANGVWFVDLADVASDAGIVRALARACGHEDVPEVDGLSALVERLRTRGRALFIVDNAEHLLSGTAAAVGALLTGVPDATCLVTSREPLRLRGEGVHRVPPLELPPEGCDDPEAVAHTEAGTLFLDRARLAEPSFALGREDAGAVARVLRRLDGIPLCLEMAAAHIAYLAPAEIDAHLEDRFALLEDDGADVPARHRTMRETLAWQVDTLTGDERLLLSRLARFAGLFDLEAAECVGGVPPLARAMVIRRLRTLVDKSLVVAVRDGERTAYRLLEVVEQFAAMPEGSEVASENAFVAWAVGVAERTHGRLYGEGHEAAVADLDRVYPSLRRAFDLALQRDADRTCRLALNLTRYWAYRGLYGEGIACVRQALAVCEDPNGVARLASAVGVFADRRGDPAEAEASYRRALGSDAEPAAKIGARVNLAILMNGQGRLEEAVAAYREAIAGAEAVGDGYTRRLAEYNLGQALLDLGRDEEGEAAVMAAADSFRKAGDLTRVALCHLSVAGARAIRDDADGVAYHLGSVLDVLPAEPDANLMAELLLDAAWLAARVGDRELAACLLGGHEARKDAENAGGVERNVPKREALATRLAAWSGETGARCRAEGRTAELSLLVRWTSAAVELASASGECSPQRS